MKKSSFFTNYTIGEKVYEEIERICEPFGQKVVLVGGKRALAQAEPLIRKALENGAMEIIDSCWYGGEAAYENVAVLMEVENIQRADIIFAVGGGKVMDTCKTLSDKMDKPLFMFPTIAATCAPITSVCAMYNLDGSFKDLYWKRVPQKHVFINTQVVADAPHRYLWAGIGDTLAKGYEPEFSARGRELDYSNSLGMVLSSRCRIPLVEYGKEALKDCMENRTSQALEEIILSIIVTTGMVSNHLVNEYNSCVAHAICYGFSNLKEVEENHLHGELVSYGILVQLVLDERFEEVEKLLPFYRELDLPTSYRAFGVGEDEIKLVAQKASLVDDVKVAPFEITERHLYEAMMALESFI